MERHRPLSDHEKKLVRRLIHSGVHNNAQLLKDGLECEVCITENDDSLTFNIPDWAGTTCIVAEAEYQDTDGTLVTLTARTVDGKLAEIEVWKIDGSRLAAPIVIDKVDVFWPAEAGKKGWWEQ
jgi:hypothetical protein